MLSTKPVKNAGQARFYFYEKDNYYFKDSPDAKELSQWEGKGAASLGLTGNVDPKQFEQMLTGKLPNGQQLGKIVNNEIKHRAGYDLTFNAPKSVSLLTFIGGDKRLIEAHSKAVSQALTYVERLCAQARVTTNGAVQYENTKNLVFATFLQDLSRALDPHLHTHCVTMNATLRSNGLWRALASNINEHGTEVNGFWERVRSFQRYLGLIYRSELAYEVKQLGYELVKKGNGLWEIAGVAKEDIDFFSKRRRDIEAFLKSHGMEGARAASYATLATRMDKKSIDRKELHKTWKEFTKTSFDELIQNSQQPKPVPLDAATVTNTAMNAMNYAIEHLSEKKSVITELELLNTALIAAIGEEINIDNLVTALETTKKEGNLIPIANQSGQLQFTTPTLLKHEQGVIQHIAEGKGVFATITNEQKLKAYFIQQFDLDRHSKSALKTLFSSNDQIMGLDIRGTNEKDNIFKAMNDLARLGKHKVIGLGINKLDADKLKKDGGFKRVETVFGFIHRIEHQSEKYQSVDGKNVIVVINNAEQLGSRNRYKLTEIARKARLRLIFQFDKCSTHSLSVGSPMDQLTQHGLLCPTIDNRTAKQSSQLEQSTKESLALHIEKSFGRIKSNIFSIKDENERLAVIAKHYSELPFDKRSKTRVLMPSIAQAQKVNDLIHNRLKALSHQDSNTVSLKLLSPCYLTKAQYRLARNYKIGQWVRFNETYRSLNVRRSDYVKIDRINVRDNTVCFKTQNGKIVEWKLDKVVGSKHGAIEVFNEVRREIIPGEKIIVNRNMRSKSLLNGQILTVKSIQGERIKLIDEQSKLVQLNLKHHDARHFDYGYAQTAHRHMNFSNQDIIAHQLSTTRTTSQRGFYKLISQGQNGLTIYTDDRDRYLQKIQNTVGDNIAVVDEVLKGSAQLNGGNHSNLANNNVSINQLLNSAIAILVHEYSDTTKTKDPSEIASEAINYAIANCAEREAAFTHKEIIETALKHALGDVSPGLIEKSVHVAEKRGILLRGQYVSDGTKWTTPKALERERFILDFAKNGKDKHEPIVDAQVVNQYLEERNYTHEQQVAAKLIAASTDSVVIIQGAPGTGKTTLLRATNELLTQENHKIYYLAPTHSAVKELNKEGLNAITVQKYLAEFRKMHTMGAIIPEKNALFVVDESSFVSNRQAKEFFQSLNVNAGRGVFVGDNKQLSAIEAGKPSTLLEWNNVKTAYLSDIKRQQNEVLLSAVKAAYDGRFRDSFKLLENHFVDDKSLLAQAKRSAKQEGIPFDPDNIDRKALRFDAAKEQFLTHFDKTGQMPLLITLTNNDRRALNDLIREDLIQRGHISKSTVETTILEPQHYTEVDRARVTSYETGQLLRFNLSQEDINIQKGEYLTVEAIKENHNLLLLKKQTGECVAWRPKPYQEELASGVEVYTLRARQLSEGDRIRWTRSDPDNNRVGGGVATVLTVKNDFAEIKIDEGKTITLNLKDKSHQHWDHAYAATTYFAQGKTDDKPIALLESYQVNLANQANFLVAISRAKFEATIITDDPNLLLKQVLKNSGEKLSALEIMGEISAPTTSDSGSCKPPTFNNNTAKNRSQEQPTLYWQCDYISEKLSDNIESVLGQILGEPRSKTGHQYRYGSNKGSLFVTIDGDKLGWWKDFQTDEGGRSLLSLIQRETTLGFKETLDYSAGLLGLTDNEKVLQTPILNNIKISKTPAKTSFTDHQNKMIKVAQNIARGTQDPHGTVVEQYLREHRGITSELPKTIGFHPSVYIKKYNNTFPAMVTKMLDEKGRVQSIHMTLLDENTANKVNVEDSKIKYGPTPDKVAIDITNKPTNNDLSLIAEGLETAMSLASALPDLDIKSSLDKQNFKRIDTNKVAQNVVLCLDNDLKDWQEDKVINNSIKRLVNAGKTVWIAQPDCINGKKTDFNDLLNHGDLDPIKETISNAKTYHGESNKSLGETMNLSQINDSDINQLEKEEAKIEKLCEQFINQNDKNYLKESTINLEEKFTSIEGELSKLSDDELIHLMQNQAKDSISINKITDNKQHSIKAINHQLEQEL